MANKREIFDQQYGSDEARGRYARLEAWFLDMAERLDLQPAEWRCLMDCLNGKMMDDEINLQPGMIEDEVSEVHRYDPERFNRWEVELETLTAKIEPLSTLHRLALHYRVQWLFELPGDVQERWLRPDRVEAN
ncbi:MAG: hypothetical protein BGO49_20250 [Planctomycetales bacterium 71-10]|nr:MAG: hypothetical protein BGO49_20250 [Planctomycetales bacterium 71-10]